MAEHLASIYGTEKDRVNCPFYNKMGACRHGDRCSRIHNRPAISPTLLLANMYQRPDMITPGVDAQGQPLDPRKIQEHFEDFFEDLFEELGKFGEIESLNICDNLADHMIGNVYVQFKEEDQAAAALKALQGRSYLGRPIIGEFSPVTDFREATCRQYEEENCSRGGYCNFMHVKLVSREMRRKLFGRRSYRRGSRSISPRGRREYGRRGDRDRDPPRREFSHRERDGEFYRRGSGIVKVFVGQIPKHMSESQLLTLFQEFAVVDEVNIIKDKFTRASRGCCFVICPSREEADKLVNACHNKKTLPGAASLLQVKYADGELERLEHKLFVGMLPKNVSEAELLSLFSKHGTIKDLQILRGAQQTSKGCAFLKYETKEQAVSAMESINGKHKMEGSTVPLVVKWADTERERHTRRLQKAQSHLTRLATADPTNPSLFGALPMSYAPPYNGYGYHQAPGTYGYMLPPIQNQAPLPNLGNSNALQRTSPDSVPPRLARRNFPLPPANYMGSGYPPVRGLPYPLAHPRGIMNPRPLSSSPGSISPGGSTPLGIGLSSVVQSQTEGPEGANLFIYNIPREYGDQELAAAFQPYGIVLSAKVFVDKATGVSKCFGFVSYDSQAAAQNAIDMMNGRHLGGKKLKVQLKRDDNNNNNNKGQQSS